MLKTIHAAAARPSANGAKVFASWRVGSSSARSGEVILLSVDVAHAQSRVCPATKCGMPNRRKARTAKTVTQTTMTTAIKRTASRPCSGSCHADKSPDEHPWEYMQWCPDERRENVRNIEAIGPHLEDAGNQGNECADSRGEASQEDTKAAVASEECFAVSNELGISVQGPTQEDALMVPMP